jgi:tRNA dimethylallyltransferase
VIVAIVGATGTGKSGLSLDLAERFAARGVASEVVNADAMQLYRGMDIGTAKLSVPERRGFPHHLLDILEISDESSVADYQVRARAAIEDILGRGVVPILVGGSGLYVSSVLWNFRFPGTDPDIRARLESDLTTSGPGILHQRLGTLDPEAARAIGAHNGRRLVRALEVIEITGERFGSGLPDDSALWKPTTIIGLQLARETLVPRLNARVKRMWSDGSPPHGRSDMRRRLRSSTANSARRRRSTRHPRSPEGMRAVRSAGFAVTPMFTGAMRTTRTTRDWSTSLSIRLTRERNHPLHQGPRHGQRLRAVR